MIFDQFAKPGIYNFKEALKLRLNQELPGEKAHRKLAPMLEGRLFRSFKPNENAKPSAVLILIFFDDIRESLSLLLTLRSSNLNSHKGQISFPGGKREMDENPVQTALREAREEVGLLEEKVEILGNLSRLYIPPSNSIITPVVGYIDTLPDLTANSTEVDEIFSVGLDILSDKNNLKRDLWDFNGKKVDTPYWDVHERTPLWGATAMIISELIDIIVSMDNNHLF